jgi:cytoskeletal protein CcmA (bactofilin family)
MNKKEATVARGEIKAFLGEGTDFKGILTFEGTVRVDGELEGEVYTKDTLIVGESAVVAAEINVHTIVISGVVRGNINATGKIEVHRPGKLFGNVKTPSLYIEEGVIFEGNCAMAYDAAEGTKVSSITQQHDEVGEEDSSRAATVKTD